MTCMEVIRKKGWSDYSEWELISIKVPPVRFTMRSISRFVVLSISKPMK